VQIRQALHFLFQSALQASILDGLFVANVCGLSVASLQFVRAHHAPMH
jgi:hypothetical protein